MIFLYSTKGRKTNMKVLIQRRNYSLDIIRIVAVLAVVMIHCCAPFVLYYEPHTVEFAFGNLFDSIARVGVPLFLMISGALFLDERKEITLKSIISKHVKSLAIITIVWAIIYSIVYNVFDSLLEGDTISISDTITGIVEGHLHMWYLYMIMGIYVITPFLRKFVNKESPQMAVYFVTISFVVQFLLPAVNEICIQHLGFDYIGTWINQFQLDFFGGYVTYYLVGWYIVHVGIKHNYLKYIVYFLGLSSLIYIIFYVHFTGDFGSAYEYIGLPVFLYSISVFLILNNLRFNFTEKAIKIISGFSKLSFGTYIVHMIVLSVFIKVFPYSEHCVLYLFACFVTVTCTSFLCTYVMSKIPLLKGLVKM